MSKHILTVDDEPVIREMIQEILTTYGFRVSGASSVKEAMHIVRSAPPDLVITDIQMEDSDGFDVVEQVKAAAPKTPIILLTGVLFDPEVLRGPVGKQIAAYVEKTAPLMRVIEEVKRQLPG